MSLFEQQIAAQPAALQHLLVDPTTKAQVHAAAEGLHRVRRIWVVGTGSSQHVATLGAGMLQDAGRSAHAVSSMQFVRNAPIVGPHDGVVVVSHSGDSSYALAARALAFSAGLQTFTITSRGTALNDAVETVQREPIDAASIGYTSAVMVFAMIAAGMGAETVTSQALAAVPAAVATALQDPRVDGVPPQARVYAFTGAGPASATAAEGALKTREAARAMALAADAEFFLHGVAAGLTSQDHLIVLSKPEADGFVAGVAAAGSAEGIGVTMVTETAPLPPLLAQIPTAVRLQVLALRLAIARGVDPDAPLSGGWADPALRSLGHP